MTFRAQWAGQGLVVTCPRCGKKNRIPRGSCAAAATSQEARPLGEYNSRAIPEPIGAPGEAGYGPQARRLRTELDQAAALLAEAGL